MKAMHMLVTVGLIISAGMASGSEFRLWKDQKENVLEASFVKMAPGVVYLKAREGRTIKIHLDSLSAEDQQYLAKTIPPSLTIELDTEKKEHSDRAYEQLWITCSAEISKSEASAYSQEMTAVLLVFGKDEVNDDYVLKSVSERPFQFENKVQREMERVSAPRLEMNSGKGSREAGAEYDGFLVVVLDPDGTILARKGSRDFYEEHAEKLLALDQGCAFDKSLAVTSEQWRVNQVESALARRRFRR